MPLEQTFYSLKNVRINFKGGAKADATEIKIARKLETADRTAGLALTEQTVIVKEKMPEIAIKGWNSDDLTIADLTPWTPIESFTLLSTEAGTPSILWTDFFTKWPTSGMCLGDTDTTLGEKPSEWSTQILCGVLNPGDAEE